jgi:hypothetical protein
MVDTGVLKTLLVRVRRLYRFLARVVDIREVLEMDIQEDQGMIGVLEVGDIGVEVEEGILTGMVQLVVEDQAILAIAMLILRSQSPARKTCRPVWMIVFTLME